MTPAATSALGFVLLGPPGAGKGTVAKLLARRRGMIHLSTGDLIRAAIAAGDELGRRVEDVVASGGLVDDDTVEELLRRRLESTAGATFLFDGYPRNLNQAERLERLLTEAEGRLAGAVALEVPADEVVRRLSARLGCPVCGRAYNLITKPPRNDRRCDADNAELVQRPDDDPETVRRRLEVYAEKTAPVLDYYADRERLHAVSGVGAIEDVYERAAAVIEKLLTENAGEER